MPQGRIFHIAQPLAASIYAYVSQEFIADEYLSRFRISIL